VKGQPSGHNPKSASGATPTDFTFTGQRNEAGFGLMDYNARYYNPRLGRFISPDTIVPEPGSSGGFNRYRYTRNNPLKYTDPSGHCEEFGDDECWSEYEKIKFIDKCDECETVLTGDGLVPLHEANFDRLTAYRENRIVNPVTYEIPPALEAVFIMTSEAPDALVLGANAGFLPPGGTTQGPTIGVEAVINSPQDTSIFEYDGVATGPGIGGSLSSYVGAVWNLENNQNYTEDFESLTGTLAFGEGANITVFWAPDFTADKPFGVAIGPAVGMEASVMHSRTYYRELLTNRR
jgi:RHS repeat-associated protein